MISVRADILRRAEAFRAPGYLEACLLLGRPSPDGRWMEFTEEDYAKLRHDHALPASTVSPMASRVRISPMRAHLPRQESETPPVLLGDLIHRVAGPIGRAIHWPCMKGDGGTELKPDSPCARARAALNRIKV